MAEKTVLLLIDPQNSFCKPETQSFDDKGVKTVNPAGSLFVPGADKDMERVGNVITALGSKLNEIHVSLDSHHKFQIFHPCYWLDSNNQHPAPFTCITREDVEKGTYRPVYPVLAKTALEYVTALETQGNFPLVIWPEHCLIGSEGHNVYKPLFDTLCDWEQSTKRIVNYVTKGSSLHTEHYSIFGAEVPRADDPFTQLNIPLISTLEKADVLYIAGEALTHCVFNSLKDLVKNFNDTTYIEKVVVVTDAMSPVPGFDDLVTAFNQFCDDNNIKRITTDEIIRQYS